jgi:hypothetical protein
MSQQNIVSANQRIVVLSPTRKVDIVTGGPGPPGPPGPSGTGAGGFNHTQIAMPVAVEIGETWYKTDTGQCFVWVDDWWVQFAPGGPTGKQGPQGPPGPSGSEAQTFVHNQATPTSVWAITHSLPYPPNITIVDSAGSQIEGDIVYTSGTVVTVTLSAATSGKAFLS